MLKKHNVVEFEVEAPDEGFLLQKYLERKRGISAKGIKKLKYQGAVLLNGQKTLMNVKLRAGDRLTLIYPSQKISSYLVPEDVPLNICYEDQDILLVEKPPKLCVHPTKGHPRKTLANGVLFHWQEQGERATFHLINRLDLDTSGLILIAKNSYAAQQLFNQQRDKVLQRRYLALVEGRLAHNEGTIDLPIARVEGRTTRRLVAPEGVQAITHFQVHGYYQSQKGEQVYTLLAISLETGRTHQIRVHFSHLGHPLVGDVFYGAQDSSELERQFLHANYLSFIHPRSQERMEFSRDLPWDLNMFLNNLNPIS
ncbi:MAG: RluA family pseudouridine synthase [Peptococcia bacterium]